MKRSLPLLFTLLFGAVLTPSWGQNWLPNDTLYPLDRDPVPGPDRPADTVLQATESFALPAQGDLTIRNFVIPTEALGGIVHVGALRLVPGEDSSAVSQGWVRFDSTNDSRQEDAKDRVVGFPWFPQLSSLRSGEGIFAIWSPKSPFSRAPLDTAWRLHPHGDVVVTLVMQPNGQAQQIRPKVELWLKEVQSVKPKRTLVAETAPPEVGTTPEDGKDLVVDIIVPLDDEGDLGPEVLTLRMANETIDIPPGAEDYSVRDTFELPTPAKITGIFPHAHHNATKIRVDAFLPNNVTERIFEINEWQWGKQQFYRFEQPLELPQGTRLEMQIRYRNIAPNVGMAAQRIKWGGRPTDEMGEIWVQMVVQGERYALSTNQRIAEHQLKLSVESWEGHFKGDIEAHSQLALLYSDMGLLETAINHGRQAVAAAEEKGTMKSEAYNALGAALLANQYLDSAKTALEKALELNKENGQAWHNLGKVYLLLGGDEEALFHLVEADQRLPRDYRVALNLGLVHNRKEEFRMAEENFSRVLEIYPRHANATANLGSVMERKGDYGKAVELYRRALMLAPEMLQTLGPLIDSCLAKQAEAKG